MAKPSLWQRIKARFQSSKTRKKLLVKVKEFPLEEVRTKSVAVAKQARIQLVKQLMRARAMVRRLRNRDKRKVPIFLLTFDEIDQLMKDVPMPLPSRIEAKSD